MNEHARDLALLEAIKFYTDIPPEGKRRKRKKAVKSRAVPYSWELQRYVGNDPEPKSLGLDNLTALARLTLQFYMSYQEVVSPVRNEDGSIQLDIFGRPRALPKKTLGEDLEISLEAQDRIARGAVWFTKSTLYRAWDGLFGDGFYRDIEPSAYLLGKFDPMGNVDIAASHRELQEMEMHPLGTHGDVQARINPKRRRLQSTAHRFDRMLLRLIKEGRLIRCPHKNGRYMFSNQMCIQAQLPEAWEIHKERGARWEGLVYKITEVDLRTIFPQKRLKFDTDVEFRPIPQSTGLHLKHPNQAAWQRVLDRLERYILFDYALLEKFAIEEGVVATEGVKKSSISEHLNTWIKNGKIKRIFTGYYRSEMFWRWNATRHPFNLPLVPTSLDWMLTYMFFQSERQYGTPNLTFSIQEVVNFIESQTAETKADWFGDRPLRRGMISERLRAYLEKDYVEMIGPRRWRFTDYVITQTRAFWSKPGPELEPRRPDATRRRSMLLECMDLDEAIKQITLDEPFSIIQMMTTRIMKDHDQSLMDNRLRLLAKRTFLKSRSALVKAYMEGKLDEF